MSKRSLFYVCLLATLAGLILPVMAQEITTGTIQGTVTDDKGKPIADAVITAMSPRGARKAISDRNGYFIIPFLTPGTFSIQVVAAGFSTVVQDEISVKLNEKTTLSYALQPGKVEKVTVTGQAPLVDRTSTGTGSNIKVADFTASVPVGRTYSNLFATAPGVVSGGGTGAGNFSIGGASGLENSYVIDGVNITNTGYGGLGSFNIVYGSLGTGVTSDFLDEVQVKTGGFDAEFGQALGGVLNAIVKSGTNEVKGNLAFFGTLNDLEGSRERVRTELGFVNVREEDVYDFAFSMGGPFIRDKLFWFVAVNPVETKTRLEAPSVFFPTGCPSGPCSINIDDIGGHCSVSGSVCTLDTDCPGGETCQATQAFPASALGMQERVRRNFNYAGKLSWYPVSNHRFEFSFFGDPSRGYDGAQNGDTQLISGTSALLYTDFAQGGGQSGIRYGANNGAIKYSGILTPKFFIDAQLSIHSGRFSESPVQNEYRVLDRRAQLLFNTGQVDLGPANFTGGPGFLSDQKDVNRQLSLKLTNVLPAGHELKYGLQVDDIEYTDDQHYSGPTFTAFLSRSCLSDASIACRNDADCPGGAGDCAGPFEHVPLVSTSGATIEAVGSPGDPDSFKVVRMRFFPVTPATKNREMNLFAQDTWQVSARWTLKAGVRATHEKVEGSGGFTLPFDLSAPGRVGSTSFIPSEYTFDWAFAPRVGFTYDVLGNGKSKLYANYGRYYQRIPNDLAVRSFSNQVQGRINYDGPDPRTDTQTSGVSGLGGGTTRVQAGTKLPYEDEYVLGYQQQIRPDLSVEVRGIFRYQGRVLEDVQFTTLEATENYYYGTNYGYPCDPFPSSGITCPGVPAGSFDAAPFGEYVLANPGQNTPKGAGFPIPKRDYKALELIINKTFANNWAMTMNYRYSQLVGNYEGLFRNDNGQSDPNITSLFDFPNSPLISSQFTKGFLNNDRTHVLNVYPYYRWNNGFTLGAGFNWLSGTPRQPYLAHPSAFYQNSGELPGIDPNYAWWQDTDGDGSADVLEQGSSEDFFNLPRCGNTPVPDCTVTNLFLYNYKATKRGFLGRSPDIVTIDAHVNYPIQLGSTTLNLLLDIFNLFNNQEARTFNDNVESTAGVTNPDFLTPSAYGPPRTMRLAASWSF